MSISITKSGDRIVAGIPVQLAGITCPRLRQKVTAELERGERKFIFDFARTDYIDHLGIGVLWSLSKQIRNQGGELLLANPNAGLKDLLAWIECATSLRSGDQDDGLAGQPAHLHPKLPGPREGADAAERPDIPPRV